MNLVRIVGASFVACTALLSVQSGAVAVESKGGEAASKRAASGSWNADIRAGKYAPAIAKLNKVLADKTLSDEQKAMAYINRGLARQQLKQFKRAVKDYSAALELEAMSNKTRAIVVYNRGIAHQKLKRQARAIDDFTNALYLDVELAQAYYGRARLMHEVGRYEFALADFAKAMKYRHPAAHLPFYGQALAYQATHQSAKARRALSRALLLKPNFKPALDRYKEIAGAAFNPNNLVLPATKLTAVEAGSSSLPAATPPPAGLVQASTSGQAAEADRIVTGNIGTPVATTAALDSEGQLKLPYRYPGLTGATAPTPGKTPGKKLTDLRASAKKAKLAKLKRQKAAAQEVAAAPPPVDEITKKRALRVAALGKSAEITAMNMAKIAPDPVKTGLEEPKEKPAAAATETKAPAKPVNTPGKVKVAALTTAPLPAETKPASQEFASEPVTGWLVQLNSQRSEEAAKNAWTKYKSKHSSVLAKTTPVIQRADLGDKGIYFRLRLGGYDDRASAVQKCGQLKASGLSCYVVKAS